MDTKVNEGFSPSSIEEIYFNGGDGVMMDCLMWFFYMKLFFWYSRYLSYSRNCNTFVLDESRFNDFLQSVPIFNFYAISNTQTWNQI